MMIIDRFEGDYAVVETDNGTNDIARMLLPDDAKEGDVVVFTFDGYVVDREATEKRRREIAERFGKMKGGV